ncbi:hypothetical protein [Sporolactobacillus putidus]|uniref:Uncharacterized protein n=1 Tax=Sporolactobacillus putidus TaxID=492735 RepID=A0A917S2K9_9BACL|nr:hypothetical protein [Sporolactobacillus putidus]GGL53434.1 hypothetical protein GCM10007968_16900 [Sporolactobacillus putidus]
MRNRIRAHFSNLAALYDRLAPLLSDRKIKIGNVTVTAAENHSGAVATIETGASGCETELARLRSGYFGGAAVEEERVEKTGEKEWAVIRIAAGQLQPHERKALADTYHLSLRDDGAGGTLITAEDRSDRIDALIEQLLRYRIQGMSRTRVGGEENNKRSGERFALAGDGDGASGSTF